MGASGAGTTTLARAIAGQWAVPHADADDYFWIPSNPPYVEKSTLGLARADAGAAVTTLLAPTKVASKRATAAIRLFMRDIDLSLVSCAVAVQP